MMTNHKLPPGFPHDILHGYILAYQPDLRAEAIAHLAKINYFDTQKMVASDPRVPESILYEFACKLHLAKFVVSNEKTDPLVARKIIQEAVEILYYAASRKALIPMVWEAIKTFVRKEFPRGLAKHPDINPNDFTLRVKGYGDHKDYHLYRKAYDPNTSPDVLRQLAEEGNDSLREIIASNPSTPRDTVFRLISCGYTKALFHPSIKTDDLRCLANSRYKTILYRIALHPKAPPDILAKLANHEDQTLRFCVAINRGTPHDVIARLAKDRNYDVRTLIETEPAWRIFPRLVCQNLRRENE